MKRQRSKQELLNHMRVYECLKKDEARGKNVRGNTAYWRLGVEWAATAWKIFNMSGPEILKLVEYVNARVLDVTDSKREEINKLIGSKGCDWKLKNMANEYTKTRSNNYVDLAVRQLEYHNTQVAVDYSLIAFEYVINNKNFGKKRLDKAIDSVYYLDALPAAKVWELRQELYEKKRIWIQLDDEQPEECTLDNFDEKAVEMFQS